MAMGMASKTAGDWAFRAFTTGLACGTLYFAYGFSVNVYRGISWHKAHVLSLSLSLSLSVTFFLFGYFFFDLKIMLSAIALGCVNVHSRFQDPIFNFFFLVTLLWFLQISFTNPCFALFILINLHALCF